MSAGRDWLRTRGSRVVAGLAFAVVAGVTGWVSYLHIEELTLALHQPMVVARIMPFGIDGLIVVGSVALLQASDDHPRLGWLCVAPGAIASLFANVESGIRYGPLAAAWAGMASAGFFLATFTLERWLKAQADRGGSTGQPQTAPSEKLSPEGDTESCSHSIAGSLDEAIVQAFLHSRDCLGEPLSQRQLSDAFGRSRPTVAKLVAPWLDGEPETVRSQTSERPGYSLAMPGDADVAELVKEPAAEPIRYAALNGSHS